MRIAAVMMLLLMAFAMTAAANEVTFVDTYAQAKLMAADQNKDMLITFYADW
jgi:uncharacterized protein YigA (DUF484 family)